MRKIQVLGITLVDYSLKESMRKVDDYLKERKTKVITYMTIKGIMTANENETVRAFLEKMDMTIAADTDILRAADAASRNRIREVAGNEFMEEFLKKLARNRKSVCLLTETNAQLLLLKEYVRSYQENLNIAGGFALEELQTDEDFLINEINIKEPNVLISLLSDVKRMEFLDASQMKINVNIWLMLKEEMSLSNKHRGIFQKLYQTFMKKLFIQRVNQYNNNTGEEKE
ncbi:MAG: hypothetical protein NC412_05285 [Roseburia sp.]|nr:hypothetical protein [Roseburia sp.]MCM1277572.1 hypothetical protein [Robinsoniella sp.]